MKKAKIVLSVTGLLSIIAGAFAFKAQHKFLGQYSCFTQNHIVTYAQPYTLATKNVNLGVTLTCTTIAEAPFSSAKTIYVTAGA